MVSFLEEPQRKEGKCWAQALSIVGFLNVFASWRDLFANLLMEHGCPFLLQHCTVIKPRERWQLRDGKALALQRGWAPVASSPNARGWMGEGMPRQPFGGRNCPKHEYNRGDRAVAAPPHQAVLPCAAGMGGPQFPAAAGS